MRIACARIEHGPFGVDTPEDLERARRPARTSRTRMTGKIAFQGLPGAYSDLACRVAYPDMATLPCESFETAMDAVREGRADLAMLPCENSLAGRVPDIHHLLPESGLFVIGEHFHRVEHCLLGVKGAAISDLQAGAFAHRGARTGAPQPPPARADAGGAGGHRRCGPTGRGVEPQGRGGDRLGAGSARSTGSTFWRPTSRTPAITRRASMSWRGSRARPDAGAPDLMTTFVFRVRNVPAALYKALGGFATNGVNMTKLESYMLGGHFVATQFLCDADGHPEQPGLRRALEELSFFSSEVRVLGVYPAAPFRLEQAS